MPHVAARTARTASRDRDTGRYQSHRPEQTLLYQIVDEYYPAFAALMAEQGKELPGYVQREFEEFLQCGRLEHGFLRVRCESCHAEHLVVPAAERTENRKRTAREENRRVISVKEKREEKKQEI